MVLGADRTKNQFGGIVRASLHDRAQNQAYEEPVIPIGDRSPCAVLVHFLPAGWELA